MNIGILGRRTAAGIALAGLMAGGLLAAPAQAAAGDLVVTTTDDDGAGSLREALRQTSASAEDDRITFAPSVTGTIVLTGGQLEATVGGGSGDLVIEGPGSEVLSIDAEQASRVLDVGGSVGPAVPTLEISGVSLVGGRPAGYGEDGGGLRASNVALRMAGVAVSGNQDSGDGWAPASGGGVSVSVAEGGTGSLDLVDCVVTGNTASGRGGGVHATAGVPVSVTRSMVRGNTASSVGGGMEVALENGWGGGVAADRVTVVDSTVADNTALLAGGGLTTSELVMRGSTVSGNQARQGGGLLVTGAAGTVTSSTLTGNRARTGGAVAASGATSSLTLTLATVVDNAAMAGGGLHTSGAVLLRGSVVGLNTGGDLAGDGRAVAERSLVQEPRGVPISGFVLEEDPVVRPLAEAGGATQTLVPAVNSPLVDAGESYGGSSDQRGSLRPVDDPTRPDAVDGADLGAVELNDGELVGQSQMSVFARPQVVGTARVGQVLRTDGGAWSSAEAGLDYQWLRNGVPIDGATRPRYRVSPADRGPSLYGRDLRVVLSVRVTASGAGLLPASAESDPTGFVQRGTFTMSDGPQVMGGTAVGSTLRAKPRTAAVSPRPDQVSIAWRVGRRTYFEAEDARRFVLRRGMRGKRVRVTFLYISDEFATLRRVVRKARPVH